MARILLFACDPGGANTILPLLNTMQERQHSILLYAKGVAAQKFTEAGWNPLPLDTTEVADILREQRPDIVVTGTSAEDFTEKLLWRECEQIDIPSMAILDQWISYGIRFSPYGVSRIAEYEQDKRYPYLPTRILVMDELAREELLNEMGSSLSEKVLVSGHPYFDALQAYACEFTKQGGPSQYRRLHGISATDPLIIFVSEPISASYNQGYWGYTEQSIRTAVLQDIETLSLDQHARSGGQLHVVLRPHPRETTDYSLLEKESKELRVLVDRASRPWDLLLSADLVVGMSSMMLIEAALLERPLLSVQIGLCRPDPFLLSRHGLQPVILTDTDLKLALRRQLVNDSVTKGPENRKFTVLPGATENVIRYMEQELACHSRLKTN